MREPNRMTYLDRRSYTPGTWAGGVTRGIWADPATTLTSPAAAHCWAGTATIERSAPYSYFAGRHRLQILIGGAELRLRFHAPDDEIILTPGAQYQFDGERPVEATPMGGSVVAFNLIYRADILATAKVAAIGPTELPWPLGAVAEPGVQREGVPIRLVYVVAGAVEISGEGTAGSLQAEDSLVLATPLLDAAPMLALRSAGPDAAQAILATFWLPAEAGN